MTPENQAKCDEKAKRMRDALSLKEPDRVPISISPGSFMFVEPGYTQAEINYDETLEKIKDASVRYLNKYDPDTAPGIELSFAGEGRGHEMQGCKTLFIAGMKNAPINIPENSGPQFLEEPKLFDDEMEMFTNDFWRYAITRYLPRLSTVLEPFASFDLTVNHRGINDVVNQFSKPEIKAAIQKMWEISDFYKEYNAKAAKVGAELRELGYPSFGGGGRAVVPFDKYSDTFRGTMLTMTDIYEYEEEMLKYMDRFQVENLRGIRNANRDGSRSGRFMAMALHKGFDGMLSDAQYAKYYWPQLRECIETGKEVGLIPSVFCEGKYNSRLKYLSDITPGGSVYYTFENIDFAAAKKELSGKACIGGGFPTQLLYFGTKQQVIDKVKEILDICAPGGGFIFGMSAGLDVNCKVENVEAMFDTVKTYGKY